MSEISLRPYQEEALRLIADAEDRGVRRQLGVAATGLGKGLAVGTTVLKSDGSWCPVEALEIGDFVIGANGQPTKIEGVFHRGEQPCFEVTTDDGCSIVVDSDHLWTVATDYDINRGKPWRTLETADLHQRGITSPEGRRRWRIPVVAPIEFDCQPELPIDPYILGVILGDGSITQGTVSFCPGDDWIAIKVGERLPDGFTLSMVSSPERATSYNIKDPSANSRSPNRIKSALVDLGLWGLGSLEKFIPSIYLTASVADRRTLLAALMDCDGWVGKSSTEFCTSSPRLANDVQRLAESLGIVVRPGSKMPTYFYKGQKRTGSRTYRLSLRGGGCPFALPRKAKKWNSRPHLGATRKIASITPVARRETVCIKVSAEDGLFVTEGHVVTHNTILFNSLAKNRETPTLILAHRDELISQAVDKLLQVWPEADVGVIKAERNEIDHHVVVGSVQTLARKTRRENVPTDRFGLIVVDEAHHAKAESYLNILNHFGVGEEGGPLLLGVTATPDRGDGKGLVDVFDEVVFNYDILWGIQNGYLADLRGMRVHLDNVDFTKAKVRKGDYDAGETGQMLKDANAPSRIVEAWLKYGEGRKTLAFTPTVDTADQVAAEFLMNGVAAAMVCGETPLDERRDILHRYSVGEIRVLCNAMLLTEGYDDPETSCIIMARPTKSRAFYTQAIGRGTRRHPDKEDCLVIDVVGASAQHSLVTIPSLFGIKKEDPFENGEMTVAGALVEQAEEEVRQGKLKAEEVDLFRRVLESPIAWVKFMTVGREEAYVCGLGQRENGSVMIEPTPYDPALPADSPPHYHCYVRWDSDFKVEDVPGTRTLPDGSTIKTLITNVDLALAQGVGEDYVRKNGVKVLADRNAKWRKNPPSEKQLDAAAKWGLIVDPSWDRGQFSEALSAHIEARKARSRNRPAWVKKKMERQNEDRR